MPIYEYLCRDCGRDFELLVKSSSDRPLPPCPSCQGEHLEKKWSTFAPAVATTAPAAPLCQTCGMTPGSCGLN